MLNKLKCFILGHKRYNPKTLHGNHIITIRDSLGDTLVTIDVCERCGTVYSTFLPED